MADREQLYTALRNADAAGDVDAANKIAAFIKSMPKQDAITNNAPRFAEPDGWEGKLSDTTLATAREVFNKAAPELWNASYLSDLTGVPYRQILDNYEPFSKAHGYTGNGQADFQLISGHILKAFPEPQDTLRSRGRNKAANSARKARQARIDAFNSFLGVDTGTGMRPGVLKARLSALPYEAAAGLVQVVETGGSIIREKVGMEQTDGIKIGDVTAQSLRDQAKRLRTQDDLSPAFKDKFVGKLADAAFDMPGFIALASTGTPGFTALFGRGYNGAVEDYRARVPEEERSAETEFMYGAAVGLSESVLERIVPKKIAGRLFRDGGKPLSVVQEALTEGGTEVLQGIIQDATAKGLFDPEQDVLTYDRIEEFLLGAILGGAFGGAANLVPGDKVRKFHEFSKAAPPDITKSRINTPIPSKEEWEMKRLVETDEQLREFGGELAVRAANGDAEAQAQFTENVLSSNILAEANGREQELDAGQPADAGSIPATSTEALTQPLFTEEEAAVIEDMVAGNFTEQDFVEQDVAARADKPTDTPAAKATRSAMARAQKKINTLADKIVKIREDFGAKDTNLRESIRDMVELAKQLPKSIRGKILPKIRELSTKVSQEAQQGVLNRASEMILSEVDAFVVRENQSKLKSTLSKIAKDKRIEFKGAREVEKIGKMNREEADAEIEGLLEKNTLTPEDINRIHMLRTFGGKLNAKKAAGFTGEEMRLAAAEADYILRERRSRVAVRIEKEMERREKITDEAQGAILGGRKPKTPEEVEVKQSKLRKIGQAISAFDSRTQSFEWLLDKITNDKSKELKGPLQKYHRRIVEAGTRTHAGVRKRFEDIEHFLGGIFGQRKKRKLAALIDRNSTPVRDTGIWIKGKQWVGSRNQAISIWMQWQDPSLRKTFDKMEIGETTIKQVEDFIGPDGIKIGKKLLAEYRDYFPIVNGVFETVEGYSLTQAENYSPISRRTDPDPSDGSFLDFNSPQATAKNSSLKARTKNTQSLVFKDALSVYAEHVAKMEHYIHHAEIARDLRVVFGAARIKDAITQMSGAETYSVLKRFNDDLINGSVANVLKFRTLDRLRANLTKSSLALKPAIFLKQLTSVPAYADSIPPKDFAAGIASFWKNPAKAIRTLMTSNYLQERWTEGHERDVRDALMGFDKSPIAHVSSITDKLMILTRLGDIGAIVQGGWAVYQYHYNKAIAGRKADAEAHRIALEEFDLTTKRSQQSSRPEDLGELQRGNSWSKLFTMYMTAPASYYRLEVAAFRNLMKGRLGKAEFAKRVAIYHFVLPNLFQAVASGFAMLFSEDDEQWETLMWRQARASVVGSFNGVLIMGDVLESIIDQAVGGGNFGQGIPALDFLTDVVDAGVAAIEAFKGDEEAWDAIHENLIAWSQAMGIPYETIVEHFKQIEEAVTGNDNVGTKVLKWIGYSDYALAEDND